MTGSFLEGADEIIHAPRRLAICAFLDPVQAAEFSAVRDSLGITDPALSKQVRILADAGYLESRKSTGPGRHRTWLSLTPRGRDAFRAHVERLRAVLKLDD